MGMTTTSIQTWLATSSWTMPPMETLQHHGPSQNVPICSTVVTAVAYGGVLSIPTRNAPNIVLRLNTNVLCEQIRIREINESIQRQGAAQ
jgi:hypothetical protein